MFTCRECFRKALGALFDHALPAKAYRPLWHPRTAIVEAPRARKYATTATVGETAGQGEGNNRWREIASRSAEWAAKKQLTYMQDPYHIAQHVTTVLEKDRFEEAALITRTASRDAKVTVSWNLLIDYQLRRGKIRAGLKLFNEMKKRAQLPNAQTYTIIFRGFADSANRELAVSEAIKLWNQMLKGGRLNPNTIHLNVVVKVCAKAEDIDSMFTVLATANDGLRAPNNLTYTTVLNALRAIVDKNQHGDKSEEEVKAEVQKTIARAKTIWEEVISRWRAGKIIIDEELVCSMGRILLLGETRDVETILDLIEQTMRIVKDPKLPADGVESAATEVADQGEASSILVPAAEPRTSPRIQAPGAPSNVYARPGRNSLSLVLEALDRTKKTARAIRYWGIFTKHYAVMPDAENWYRLLQAFRRGRASARTIDYLRNIPRHFAAPKHFRSAMRTCVRANLNPKAFAHANIVLKLMSKSLRLPDAQVMRNYLRVAYACQHVFEQQARAAGSGDPRDAAAQFEAARRAYGRQLETALRNLSRPYQMAARHAQVDKVVQGGGKRGGGSRDRSDDANQEDAETWARLQPARSELSELAALARKMVATYDRLISEGLISDPETLDLSKTARSTMNRFVVAFFERRLEMDPNFDQDRRNDVERKDAKEDKDEEWDESEEDRSEFFLEEAEGGEEGREGEKGGRGRREGILGK